MAAAPDGPGGEAETRLVLVRHGESQAQVNRVVGGPTGCSGLSELGRRQVGALARRWEAAGMAADRLLSSTLPRAVETAELLAPVLGGLVVETEEELCEMVPGECDGITWDDYLERYAVDVRADPYAPLSPGGESLAEFNLRVGRVLHRIAVDHTGRTVVVVCHGGIVDGSLSCFLGLPTQRARSFGTRCDNAGVTEWWAEIGEGHPLGWTLHRYNDTAHLE
ncbi:MAG: histidine phosphatase family protein [Acidimicrobiales bacterium]